MSFDSSMDRPRESVVLRVDQLAKCYRIYEKPRDRILQAFLGQRRKLYREFWALHDISFQLSRGHTIGIVGRNGSGKSTLLQLICGTLTPSRGSVTVTGRIGALLELGSGFNPEFTGRENIYLNGTVLGLSRRQIDERMDSILAFADIGVFIDQAVKTYSSGMSVRLAFAVQAHCDPQILVVDEALAVGDELFQKKCYTHLESLKEKGTSILLVTHSCPQINQHCDEAILIHKGIMRLIDEPQNITALYQRLINSSDEEWKQVVDGYLNSSKATSIEKQAIGSSGHGTMEPSRQAATALEKAWFDPHLAPESTMIYPDHGARIEDITVFDARGVRVNNIPCGEGFSIRFQYSSSSQLHAVSLACHIANHTGSRITGQSLPREQAQGIDLPAHSKWEAFFHFAGSLWPGVYFVGGGINNTKNSDHRFVHRVIDYLALRITASEPLLQIGGANLASRPPEIVEQRVE